MSIIEIVTRRFRRRKRVSDSPVVLETSSPFAMAKFQSSIATGDMC